MTPYDRNCPSTTSTNALERTTRARRRLAELLAPKTDQERELVGWLGETLDLQRLLVLAELVGYRRSR